MKKSMLLAGLALVLAAAAPAAAQPTISPGMTTEQVRERFGPPVTARAAGDWTYWYYLNGCPVRCGSDDVVFFQNDRVVAAVLRTSRRRFAGPAPDDALGRVSDSGVGSGMTDDAPAGGRVRVGGVRVDGAEPRTEIIVVPSAADQDRDRQRPQAREGRPGEPSTIIIADPDNAEAATTITPVRAGDDPDAAANPPAQGNPPAVDANPLPQTQTGANPPNAAENTEATDVNGQTSIDRANQRTRQDRANEETATERARRNDRRGRP